MTNSDTPKKQIKLSPIVREFLSEFGLFDDAQIIPVLIDNYMETIEFIALHNLDEDFILFCDDKNLYRQLYKSKFLRHPQHDETEN